MIRLAHRVSHAATMVDTGPRTYTGQAKGPRAPGCALPLARGRCSAPRAEPTAPALNRAKKRRRRRHLPAQRPPDTVDHGEADAKIKSFNQAKAERYLAERDRRKR